MTGNRQTRLVPADARHIAEAGAMLRAGGLVAFPTETVYGLGADATNGKAVADIFAAKARPSFNPLIVHVQDIDAARRTGTFNAMAEQLAARFWPGPLTLVVPLAGDTRIAPLVTAGLDSIALRVPAHPIAQALLRAAGLPIAAPSANPSGRISPTRARHVMDLLEGKVDIILDGGATMVGVESTIVGCTGPKAVLLRPGGIAREDIEAVLGQPLGAPGASSKPSAPGQLEAHYAPATPLRLKARTIAPGEALMAFGPDLPEGAHRAVACLNLSPAGDMREAAANLFAHLHALDASGARAIAVMPVPGQGLGEAINDRLQRAAAGAGRPA